MGEKKVDRFLFKLSDKLGEGSYGQVFKGRDEKTNEIVAIKMLSKNTINADDYLREGLMNEIKIMQALKGQNVVRLLDVLETSNNYYIVQEFCDGGDLQGLLKQKKKFSQNEAVKFFIDLLMGFMELVKKGIIHRDLKPANILINKGIYKIADFGFSKAIDNVQREMLTSAVGTPLYMSPQILKSQKYTSKSDIWSLGFIFYEVICGVTPWTAKSIPELIKNIKTIPVSFPTNVYIDQGYQDLIKGCLRIDEKDRLSWDEIFKHPCFGNTFQGYLDFAKQLEDKAKFLVNDLRVKVMRDKIDLEDLFMKYDYSGDKNLDIHEMTTLLHEIDQKLDRDEIEYIFNKIDEDGNGSIDLNEFKKWLEENNVRMSMKPQSQQYNKMQSFNTGEQYQQQHQGNLPFQQPPPPQLQQPSQQQQQQQYGSQQNNQFQQQQILGPGSQGQYKQMNYQQQMSGSGSPYNQYPQQYGSQGFHNPQGYPPQNQMKGSGNYPNPYPQQPYPQVYPQMQGSNQQQYGYQNYYQQQPSPTYIENQNRAQETIKKLFMAIEKYNINVWELFKKYDRSDSSTLDIKEFGIMLRRIDSSLTDQDINQAFWLFDADKSGEITFLEFKDGIQFNIERSRNATRSQSYNYQGMPQQQQWQQNKYG